MKAAFLTILSCLPLVAGTVSLGTGQSIVFHYSDIPADIYDLDFVIFTEKPEASATQPIPGSSATSYPGFRLLASVIGYELMCYDGVRMGYSTGEAPLGVGSRTGSYNPQQEIGAAMWRWASTAYPSGSVSITLTNLGNPLSLTPNKYTVDFMYRRTGGIQGGQDFTSYSLVSNDPPSQEPASTPEPSTVIPMSVSLLLYYRYAHRSYRRQRS